ncbi:MAG: TolB family protein [Thermodesulfobacteriota bacterium]
MAKPGLIICALIFCLAVGTASAGDAPGKLAFLRGGSVWLAHSDGSRVRRLTHATQDRQPALSPDGRRLAYVSGREAQSGYGRIFLMSSGGGRARLFLPLGLEGGEHPAFSADGKSLVFVGLAGLQVKKEGGSELSFATMSVSIADVKGIAVRQVVSSPNTMLDTGYRYSNPAFSPNGKLLAYQESGSDVSGGFVVINLKGEKVFSFPPDPQDATPYWRPQFSRDGQKILCYSPATSAEEVDTVHLVDLATGKETEVTEGSKPTWVDQGRAIVFERWPKERWAVTGKVTADLWRLELAPGAQAQKIITDGQEPAGQ